MKTWIAILAAGAILAFAAQAGNATLGNYPDYGVSSRHPTASKPGKQLENVEHVTKAKQATHTAIRVGNGVYGPYAYPANVTPPVRRIGP